MGRETIYSVVYCLGFVLFAFNASGMGPLIPVKAEQLGLEQTDFSLLFVFKGAGGFLGGVIGLFLEKLIGLHKAMALSFAVMALASFVVNATSSLFVIELMFLLIDATGNIMNICSTVCISHIYHSRAEPWIKSLHLCYGVGAFITPLLIRAFGVKSFFIYAIVAVPFALFMLFTTEIEQGIVMADLNEPEKPQTQPDGQLEQNSPQSEIKLPNAEPITTIPMTFDLLAACLMMLATCNEGVYAGWISSYGVMSGVQVEHALMGFSIFWVSMTVGRALIIPLSALLSTREQLTVMVSGIFLTVALCNLFNGIHLYKVVLYGCSVVMGFFMSGMYPLTMSLPSSMGLKVKPQNTSRYVLGGCLGGSLGPFLAGLLMKSFGPSAMFVQMFIVVVIAIFVFKKVVSYS